MLFTYYRSCLNSRSLFKQTVVMFNLILEYIE